MASCPQCHSTYPDEQVQCPKDGSTLVPGVIQLNPELARGSKVGEYVIETKIGSGTFGDVYQGVQPLIGKLVAIKVLSRKYSSDPMVVSRFIAEARAVNQIRHKNIIDIFSFGQLPDGRHYHVMELLEGEPLNVYVANRNHRLPIVELLPILRGLARALDAAHVAGIAHRDLKPANVFLAKDTDGTPFPKLLDFGIAKLMTDDLPRQHQTATGAAVGTPDYMSPEQCQGPDVDHRTDIYAFGVVCFQLLTGKLPFRGANVVELLMKHLTERPPKPSSVAPDVPPELDAPVLAMLEKNPLSRPSSLHEAMTALEDAARSAGFDIPLSSTGDPVARAASLKVRGPTSGSVSQPVLAATLSPELGASIPAPKRAAAPLLAGGLAAFAVGFGLVLYVQQAPPEETSTALPLIAPPQPPPPIAAPPPSPRVTLRIDGTPKGAEIFDVNGASLGRLPARLELPANDPVQLRIRSPGFMELARAITPVANGTITVDLKKVSGANKPKKKKGEGKRPGRDDLEVPSWEPE